MGVAVGILSLMLSASASAGVITWGAPQDTSGPSDVSTNGTLHESLNLTSDGAVPGTTTVNGVTFTWDNTIMGLTGGTGLLAGSTTGDADYDALLDSLDHGACDGCPWTIQVGGGLLASGSDYEIQLWYTDNRGFADSFTQIYDDGNGNTVTLDSNNNGLGQFVLGTFTADDTTQNLAISGGLPPGEPHLNAFQVRFLSGTPLVPGDANGDEFVTEADLRILLDNYFVTDPKPGIAQGNFDLNDTVDENDYLFWETEFLAGGGILEDIAGFNVPEPSSLVLLTMAGLAFLPHRRRRS